MLHLVGSRLSARAPGPHVTSVQLLTIASQAAEVQGPPGT